MKIKTVIKGIPVLLAGLVAISSQAGTLDTKLVNHVNRVSPGKMVDVIIRCTDRVDPRQFRTAQDQDISLKRTSLISALKTKANECESTLRKVLAKSSMASLKPLWVINGIRVRVPARSLSALAKQAKVDTIRLNEKVKLPLTPAPAGGSGNPSLTFWNLDAIRIPEVWTLGHDGTGVLVATMDTGVDADHADIGPKWRGGSNSWFDPNGEHATPFDANGHGTQAMGLIVGDNTGGFDIGIAPGAQWIAAKIFNDADESDLGKIHQAYQWLLDPDGNPATDDTPDIVNNSWVLEGTVDQCPGEFAQDIATLKAADIAVVFSAGNFGPGSSTSLSPANDPESLSVAAVDSLLTVPGFSSRGPSACDGSIYPRIAAPGKDVLTAGLTTGGSNPNAYAFVTGTSFASPHVAGTMALLKSAFSQASVYDLEDSIETSALDIESPGPDNDSGSGLLDAVEAYNWLEDNLGGGPGDLQLSTSAYSLGENLGSLMVTVTRTGGSDGPVSIDYATSGGSATAGQDYQSASGTLSFADGEISRMFNITIVDDSQYEGDETFTINLSNPQGGATLGVPQSAVVTILEDDPQPQPGDLQFSAATYSVDENGGSLNVSVTRTGGSAGSVSVDYATTDGTASAGLDYLFVSGTLNFVEGQLSQNFTVTIVDDALYEGDEDLNLMLSNPTGGAGLGSPANATLTILEDDPLPNNPPTITSSPVTTAIEGEAYSYLVAATDPDAGDVLTFSLDASPAGMSIDSGSGLIDWTPSGQTGPHAVTVRVTDAGGLFATQSFTIDVSAVPPGVQLYFSTMANATVPGVSGPYDDADIYHWDGSGFSRVFDASTAGLPGNADVDALVVDGAVYYMSFRRNGGTNVPGLGLVDDEDVVKYEAGVWSLYFDGGAVGLADTNGEDVDGFALLANGDILVSIVGSARVPGLGGTHRDEDLLRCQPAAVPVTSCSWSMYFDGSDVALNNSADEDVDGVSVSSGGDIQLSTIGAFNVAGLSGNDEDVFVCNAPTTGTSTACASFTLLFDGNLEGVTDDLDAIDIP